MIAHGFVTRTTQDIDLFTEIDDTEAVQVAQALRVSLEERGLHIRDAQRPPLDHRFVVSDPTNNRECTVEVFPDGGRLRKLVVLDMAQCYTLMTWLPTSSLHFGAALALATSTTFTPCSKGTTPNSSSDSPHPRTQDSA